MGCSTFGGVPIIHASVPSAARTATYLVASWKARATLVSRFPPFVTRGA